MKLTTTFSLLREKHACTEGYRTLAKHLGGVESYGADTEINILTILESNGFDDAVWSLRATLQEADNVKRLIAADFAESVLHIFESKRPDDKRPREAIQAARDFAAGMISKGELAVFRSAAYAGAAGATYANAGGAAADAACAACAAYAAADACAAYAAADACAAYAAAYAAADASAYASAYASARAAAKKEQLAAILRKHLS